METCLLRKGNPWKDLEENFSDTDNSRCRSYYSWQCKNDLNMLRTNERAKVMNKESED